MIAIATGRIITDTQAVVAEMEGITEAGIITTITMVVVIIIVADTKSNNIIKIL